MAKWTRRTLKLKENHGWTCRPGYTIFVADRGAVRFDFPKGWIVRPGENGSIKLHDAEPPDEECTLQMSVFYLRDDIDWSGLPLAAMVKDVTDKDSRSVLHFGEVQEVRTPRLHAAWREVRFIDEDERREARSRTMVARWSNIQPLFTFDFWESDAHRLIPVWATLLETLVLGDYIEDPTQRVVD